MAEAIGGLESLSDSPSLARSLRAVATLRLALGFIVLLGTILFLLGTSWDIQWHSFIGRDRTLIPPHLMMLSGVALSGVAALAEVLIETVWARRSPTIAKNSTPFAETFHSSLGTYISGFGALDAAIGFPLDSYWHAVYGIDVPIWAPFHIMIITGMGMAALGATYMLVSAAHMASSAGALGTKRLAYVGVIVAFATMMGIFTLLLFDALDTLGYINLGIMIVNVFSFLAAILGAWTFVAVVYAVPWRWAATWVAAVYLFFALLIAAFVPPATNYLLTLEHLAYLKNVEGDPSLALVTLEWPVAPIVAAILIDLFVRLARRKGWFLRRLTVTVAAAALIGSVPVPALFPFYIVYMVQNLGPVGFLVSLLLGLLGSLVGVWFGRNMGESMLSLERG